MGIGQSPFHVGAVAELRRNEQERGRLPSLIPVRRERMAESPFASYRGAAAVMAADLAATPHERRPGRSAAGDPGIQDQQSGSRDGPVVPDGDA